MNDVREDTSTLKGRGQNFASVFKLPGTYNDMQLVAESATNLRPHLQLVKPGISTCWPQRDH